MIKNLIESVDINELISINVSDFIPIEEDFDEVVNWYVKYSEVVNLQTNTNKTLSEYLNDYISEWVSQGSSSKDQIKILFRRLIASVVLKINDFSNIWLLWCCIYVSKDELRQAIKTIAQQADLFEAYREKYKNVLEQQLSLITKNNNQSQSTTSSSQNLPKYWISTKSPEGWRRTLYLDKKNSNGEYTVKFGAAEYVSNFGPDAIPFFDSLKQANDFITNIQLGKCSTRRSLDYVKKFIFNIVEINNKKYNKVLYKQNLQDYVLVNTACGKAYINKQASCY